MKTRILLLLLFPLVACNSTLSETGEGESEDQGLVSGTELVFESQLYPDRENWDYQETYSDTLEFVEYIDDYDYAFIVFKSPQGNEVQIVSAVDIDNDLKGSIYYVEWTIDTLYEAGENDEPYLQEAVSYLEIFEPIDNFDAFIRQFANDTRDESANYNHYTHEIVTYAETNKSGVYCLAEYKESSSKHLEFSEQMCSNIQQGFPSTDICDESSGAADGFYVEDFVADHGPDIMFYDENGDLQSEEFPLDEEFEGNRIKEVRIYTEEFNLCRLYFLQVGSNWYLFLKDYCDCSA